MAQIIVMADPVHDDAEGLVMLRERINVADFASDHFATRLVERLGWAVSDAHAAELTAHADSDLMTDRLAALSNAIDTEAPGPPSNPGRR